MSKAGNKKLQRVLDMLLDLKSGLTDEEREKLERAATQNIKYEMVKLKYQELDYGTDFDKLDDEEEERRENESSYKRTNGNTGG